MRQSSGVPPRVVLTFAIALICALTSARAQSGSELQEYQAAVSHPPGPEQFSALEKFVVAYPQSRLKLDALELMVWEARTSASLADLEYWTGQLLSLSPENPLGAAVVIQRSLPISTENPVSRAKRSLPALDRFDRPEGLSHDEFAAMKDYASATLNGVVGYSFFEQKDFTAARPYLRKAVELDPRNAQYTYTLALCDLQGANPDQAEGYKMLARAVNLTKGTAAGERLAAFARQNFQQAGGTSENWDKYLAATAVPPQLTASETNVVAESGKAPTPQPTPPPNNTVAGTTTKQPIPSAGANQPAITTGGGVGTSYPSANPAPSAAAATRPVAPSSAPREPIYIASNNAAPAIARGATPVPPVPAAPEAERPLRVFPPRPARHIAPGSPVSVGVLIQASLADRLSRRPVVFTLSDLIRHLREKDEAFIMSFSRGVVFQEDLTSNSKSLENAMDSIAPTPGSAIYDAVTFAAGHLDRVARNPNRVLLVIAAEGDRNSTVSPLELSSEINLSGVTIYCIGVGVMAPSDQSRLESLASSTGGRAVFISDLSRFREATRDIAQGLGINFPQ